MVNRSSRRGPFLRGGPRRAGLVAALLGLACLGTLLVVLVDLRDVDRPVPPGPAVLPTGRTIFVAAAALTPGASGTAAHPYPTIQQAVDVAGPGDTVRVGPGDYVGFHTVRSGSFQNPIRLSAVNASITSPGAGSPRLVDITDDYLEIAGFELVGGTAGIRLYGAHNVSVVHNVVRDALGECVRVKHGSTNNIVAFNTISDCGRRNFNLAEDRKNGEGVYIGTAPEQLTGTGPDDSGDNWIHDNKINTPAECVDIKEFSTAILVEHNMCTGGQDPDSAGFSARGDRVTFRGNTVSGGAGAGIRLGGDKPGEGVDAVVVDNEVDHPNGYGIKIMRTPQARICGNGLLDPGEGPSNLPTTNPALACP